MKKIKLYVCSFKKPIWLICRYLYNLYKNGYFIKKLDPGGQPYRASYEFPKIYLITRKLCKNGKKKSRLFKGSKHTKIKA